jgi:hypothetical protein
VAGVIAPRAQDVAGPVIHGTTFSDARTEEAAPRSSDMRAFAFSGQEPVIANGY